MENINLTKDKEKREFLFEKRKEELEGIIKELSLEVESSNIEFYSKSTEDINPVDSGSSSIKEIIKITDTLRDTEGKGGKIFIEFNEEGGNNWISLHQNGEFTAGVLGLGNPNYLITPESFSLLKKIVNKVLEISNYTEEEKEEMKSGFEERLKGRVISSV